MDIDMEWVKKHLPGFRFNPTDEQLVNHYLRRSRRNQAIPSAFVFTDAALYDADLYGVHPRDLAAAYESKGIAGVYYFYAAVIPVTPERKEMVYGRWKASDDGEVIRDAAGVETGVKRCLVYYEKSSDGGAAEKETDWVIHEYKLAGAGATEEDSNFAFCRMYNRLETSVGVGSEEEEFIPLETSMGDGSDEEE